MARPKSFPAAIALCSVALAVVSVATSLKKAGVKVEHKNYEGTTHEFFGMAAVVPGAKGAQALAGKRLRETFEQASKL